MKKGYVILVTVEDDQGNLIEVGYDGITYQAIEKAIMVMAADLQADAAPEVLGARIKEVILL